VVARHEVIAPLGPGSHGSTFGGNPLACAVAREVIAMLHTGEPQRMARGLGAHLAARLEAVCAPGDDDARVTAVRTIGLWAGIDIAAGFGTARSVSEALMRRGVLVKDTNVGTLRLAPPLTISRPDLDLAVDRLAATLRSLQPTPRVDNPR
jgi:ornithine--oxo-acid transaminase